MFFKLYFVYLIKSLIMKKKQNKTKRLSTHMTIMWERERQRERCNSNGDRVKEIPFGPHCSEGCSSDGDSIETSLATVYYSISPKSNIGQREQTGLANARFLFFEFSRFFFSNKKGISGVSLSTLRHVTTINNTTCTA